MSNVLIVEDDDSSRNAMVQIVADEGHEVSSASTLSEGRSMLREVSVDLVLADLVLPDGEGLELLRHDDDQDYELALITADTSFETAIEALRLGAIDYLTKPVDVGRLRALLKGLERTSALKAQVSSLRKELFDSGRFGPIVGASAPMREVYSLIEKVARTDTTVFVTGESGTGKELVAQTIHELSGRNDEVFVPVNCGAVSATLIESELFGHERGAFTGAVQRHQGYFERASGGTLFLDEITEMPIELQVKLLRVLETGKVLRVGGTQPIEVDVRVLAATNQDPSQAIVDGALREDLFYRLRVYPIHLPPLRERGAEDIELLARTFLSRLRDHHDSAIRLTDEALDLLTSYSWPGNVRELKNALERAHILADERITTDCLPLEIRSRVAPIVEGPYVNIRIGSPLADAERRLILATLDEFGGKRNDTAEALGISQRRSTTDSRRTKSTTIEEPSNSVQGQKKREAAALTRAALELEITTEVPCRLTCERQSEALPESYGRTASTLARPEDRTLIFIGDSRTVVFYRNFHGTGVCLARRNLDETLVLLQVVVLERVANQIHQDQLSQTRVNRDLRDLFLHSDLDASLASQITQELGGARDNITQG